MKLFSAREAAFSLMKTKKKNETASRQPHSPAFLMVGQKALHQYYIHFKGKYKLNFFISL
jgi:hypothetical protein